MPSAQIVFVRLVSGRDAAKPPLFATRQSAARERRRNADGDLVLNVKDVIESRIESLGPATVAGVDFDELHVDAKAITGLVHAPFEQCAHAQPISNRPHVSAELPELKRRGASRDAQAIDVRECVDELVGQTLAQ